VVRLTLVGQLPVDDGEVTFQFPLVVAPRYMPGAALVGEPAGLGIAADTSLVPDASRISPPVRLPGMPNPVRLSLRVMLEDHDVRDLASSLHAVTTSTRDAQIVELRASEREHLDRDFILRWRVDTGELRTTLVCDDDEDGRGGTFSLTLVPPTTTSVTAKPRDLVLVLDRSGSMGGWKMVAARRAAARVIDSLTSRDRFSVIAFDNLVDELAGAGLQAASDRQRFRAIEALARVEARGGTELAEPLMRALRLLGEGYDDRERAIVLVTDGQVGNEDQILAAIAPALRKTRVFTLGIDQAVNAGFLRRLAAAGGGLCELVESEDRLDAVMAKVHRRIGTPVATELALDAKGLDLDRARIAPRRLSDVYAGAPVVVLGRYKGRAAADAQVVVEATSFGDPFRAVATRSAGNVAEHNSLLAACWARAHVRDLEDRYASGAKQLEDEIVAVSKRFGVLSRFTAFVAIDREIANRSGRVERIVQRVEPPAGWGADSKSVPMPAPSAPVPMSSTQTRSAAGLMPRAPSAPSPARASLAGAPPREAPPAPPRQAPQAPPAPPAQAPTSILGYAAPSSPSRFHTSTLRSEPPAEAEPEPIVPTAHREQLAQLARELEALAMQPLDVNAVRRLRERLREWLEDVRSIGGDKLADAVVPIIARLSAALAAHGDLEAIARTVANELTAVARDEQPSGKPRAAFWK
jgi:Ca-activated chloride channel family protein